MAKAILADLATGLIAKVGSLLLNEIWLWWGVTDELHKLRRTVSTIGDEQSLQNPQDQHWLGLLSEAMLDAEDLLDEFSTEALRQQVMPGCEASEKIRVFFSGSNQIAFGYRMGRRIKALRVRLDEIAAEKVQFRLEQGSAVQRSSAAPVGYLTRSHPPRVAVGRGHEKEEIVRLLLSSDHDANVSAISIVGIGGLGKTTLAQMIYNDHRVESHFRLRMWVCVSNDFDVDLLAKKFLESATEKPVSIDELVSLKNRLHDEIGRKKFLLVLDDVWSDDVNKWFGLLDLLACGGRGSKIVVTTRLERVARMSQPIFTHKLKFLSENESWSLFEKVAFEKGHLPTPSLKAMGEEIVAKCGGVPLAIIAIGGALYLKDPSEWVSFKDKELSTIDVFQKGILPALRLSYNHLPIQYKHCFAYCSLFPKDCYLRVDKLIQLWKAQGYLKSMNTNESLTDVGFRYFMDLYRFSFFQDVVMDAFGDVAYCKMHDLMHDLATSVAGDNFFASHSGMTTIHDKTQHLSFYGGRSRTMQDFSSMLGAKKMRTVLSLYQCGKLDEKIYAVFCNLTYSRVLDLSLMGIKKVPKSISKACHLRYLDLSHNHAIRELPNSVTDLPNLQVLNLDECHNLMQLPRNITRLVNLIDLNNYKCNRLSHMPQCIGKLTRLEKLSESVLPSDESISKHSGGLRELHSLNNLRGGLEIRNLGCVKNAASDFKKACLSLKPKIHKLTLHWGSYEDEYSTSSGSDVANEETGFEALCPHPNLKELVVWHYRGVKPPSWLPSITSLVSVGFHGCKRLQWLWPLDHLPHLKMLSVCDSTKLERIDVEYRGGGGSSSFFPSLTFLTLDDCPKLKGFERLSPPSREQIPSSFPCLSRLKIRGCPNLSYIPLFPELKVLYVDGDGLKLVVETLKMPENSASTSTSPPLFTLSQLQHLQITKMGDPAEDDLLQYLPSLQSLTFWKCSFRTCEMNDGEKWRNLKVLRSVEFQDVRNLVALPKGLQYVTALQRLYINGCPRLECMPEWIPKLTALQDLTVNDASLLQERCKNNSAEDWPNISHIPNIQIHRQMIQGDGCYLL